MNVVHATSLFARRYLEAQAERHLRALDRLEQAVDELYRFGQHAIAHRCEGSVLSDDEVMADPLRRRLALSLTRDLAELSVIYERALTKTRAKLRGVA